MKPEDKDVKTDVIPIVAKPPETIPIETDPDTGNLIIQGITKNVLLLGLTFPLAHVKLNKKGYAYRDRLRIQKLQSVLVPDSGNVQQYKVFGMTYGSQENMNSTRWIDGKFTSHRTVTDVESMLQSHGREGGDPIKLDFLLLEWVFMPPDYVKKGSLSSPLLTSFIFGLIKHRLVSDDCRFICLATEDLLEMIKYANSHFPPLRLGERNFRSRTDNSGISHVVDSTEKSLKLCVNPIARQENPLYVAAQVLNGSAQDPEKQLLTYVCKEKKYKKTPFLDITFELTDVIKEPKRRKSTSVKPGRNKAKERPKKRRSS